ncbi:Uncharacterized protein HZ326_2229 [Fusarium oxysporum f. sp. albedinis]|nr:Uncharacterized protein HZ326_2229 [Fusarium oxysporum f. sp. albedinis]
MGRSRRRAEVDLALTEEDKSGLGWVGRRPKGDVDFWPSRGVNKGQGGSFQAIGPVSTLTCLPLGPCTRSEWQGAA